MKRKEAIKYLEGKGKIEGKYDKEDEKEIQDVIKRGKIYGDPTADIDM